MFGLSAAARFAAVAFSFSPRAKVGLFVPDVGVPAVIDAVTAVPSVVEKDKEFPTARLAILDIVTDPVACFCDCELIIC